MESDLNMSWFRMYAEAVDDEKLRLLAFEDRWHFVAILCLKCQGSLDSEAPHMDRRIALKLGLQLPQLDEVKRRLIEVGLITDDWQPVRWESRQYKSDRSADRTRAWRERQKKESHGDVTVTDKNRTDTEQTRAEKGADAPARATRLPDDFELTTERRAVAEAERLPADRTFVDFCDYWRAASGQKARKCDWDATWRNWCRRQVDFRPARQQPGRPSALADEWPELRARATAINFREPREGESPQAYQTLLKRAEFDAAEAAKGSKPLRAALDTLLSEKRA